MDTSHVRKLFKQKLYDNGFRGILPASEARKIIKETIKEMDVGTHDMTVEQSPVHSPGEQVQCNCDKAIITVIPKT